MIPILICLAACGRAVPPERTAMSATVFYDFRIGGENRGWFEIADDGREIAMNAVFTMGGETYANPFRVRHAAGRATAYRVGDGDWVEVVEPRRRQPTSAYPLLVAAVRDRLTYVAITEGSGAELGETLLERSGDTVIETRGGKTVRSFTLDSAGRIVRIAWGGGAVSEMKADRASAVAGSPHADGATTGR